MKILLTGGCGFIGVNLAKRLYSQEHRITVVDNLSSGDLKEMEDLEIDFHEMDIRDKNGIEKVSEGMDAVIHLAAQPDVVYSIENPFVDFQINIEGTLNLLAACARNKVGRFVFASSSAPLGEQIQPVDETKVPKPLSPYGASKLSGEAYCSAFGEVYGIESIALRFSNVYGPYSGRKGSVIPIFMRNILEGRDITVYGNGEQTRDFVHVGDICRALDLALTAPCNSYDFFQIASGTETSVNRVIELLREVTKIDTSIVYAPERTGEIIRNHCDISKAIDHLGYRPQIGLREGLQNTWEYFRKYR